MNNHVSSLKYRSDIDGLRAVAVILVVVFHASPMWCKGGFIGVDIFFVISGYLISSIILNDLKHNKFSFSGFYERRIKRIFPALILVVSLTVFLGWILLVQEDFMRLAKHVVGSSLFLSNFLLLKESGYFDDLAYSKPLLHLWSLAVEEQFYLFWPILLSIFYKFRNRIISFIFITFILSFSLNIFTSIFFPFFAFYSPLTIIRSY
ncbi:acyltransferase family protein [Fluviispira multicolorata]|uniref:acyltransferase family protein n=1 Tax=Fluviispira multicolorata TaxID=2654512 RepID=UPI00137577D8|nr:acyltransferase [Fluviispira multicolorata]